MLQTKRGECLRDHDWPTMLARPLADATSTADVGKALQALACPLACPDDPPQHLVSSPRRPQPRRAMLTAQVASRTISNTVLAGAADTAAPLSGRVRSLDLEKARVQATLKCGRAGR